MAQTTYEEEPDKSWMRTVAVIWLAELIAIMGMSLVIPFLPLYLEELHVPAPQISLWAGWVGGANFLCAAILAPVWGALADRFGRKLMALRALVGLAVAVGLMGFVQNVYQLFGLRMLQGAFGGFVAAAIALAGTSVPRKHLGSALGILQTAVVGGNLVGPLLGGELSHRFGYRHTFFITGGALFIAMLLIFFLVRERAAPEPEEPPRGLATNLRELVAIPEIRWVALIVVLSQSGLMLINPQVSLFVKELLRGGGEVNRLVGLVIAAPALGSFLLAPWWGRAGDRRGPILILIASLSGAALAMGGTAASQSLAQLFGFRFCLGAFTSAFNPAAHSALARRVEKSRTAAAFSFLSSAQMLGGCLGPFASGPLASLYGIRSLFGASALLLAGGCLAAIRVRSLGAPEKACRNLRSPESPQ